MPIEGDFEGCNELLNHIDNVEDEPPLLKPLKSRDNMLQKQHSDSSVLKRKSIANQSTRRGSAKPTPPKRSEIRGSLINKGADLNRDTSKPPNYSGNGRIEEKQHDERRKFAVGENRHMSRDHEEVFDAANAIETGAETANESLTSGLSRATTDNFNVAGNAVKKPTTKPGSPHTSPIVGFGHRRRNYFPVVRVSSRLKESVTQQKPATCVDDQTFQASNQSALKVVSDTMNRPRKWRPISAGLGIRRRIQNAKPNERDTRTYTPKLSVYEPPSRVSSPSIKNIPHEYSRSTQQATLQRMENEGTGKKDTRSTDMEVERILERRRHRRASRQSDSNSETSSFCNYPDSHTYDGSEATQSPPHSIGGQEHQQMSTLDYRHNCSVMSGFSSSSSYSFSRNRDWTSTPTASQLKRQLGEWISMGPESRIEAMAARLQSKYEDTTGSQKRNAALSSLSRSSNPPSAKDSDTIQLFNLNVRGRDVDSIVQDAAHALKGGASMLRQLFHKIPLRIDSIHERQDGSCQKDYSAEKMQFEKLSYPIYTWMKGCLSGRTLGNASRLQLIFRYDEKASMYFPIGEPQRSGTGESVRDMSYTLLHIIECGLGPSTLLKESPKAYTELNHDENSSSAYSLYIHMDAQKRALGEDQLDERVECLLDLRVPSKSVAERIVGALLLVDSITPRGNSN